MPKHIDTYVHEQFGRDCWLVGLTSDEMIDRMSGASDVAFVYALEAWINLEKLYRASMCIIDNDNM